MEHFSPVMSYCIANNAEVNMHLTQDKYSTYTQNIAGAGQTLPD